MQNIKEMFVIKLLEEKKSFLIFFFISNILFRIEQKD